MTVMAKSRKVRKIRKADEFSLPRLKRPPRSPSIPSTAYSWDLASIMDARDAQLRGTFRAPVQLASSMRTDDALFVARRNRLAPLRCLGIELTPGKGPRAGTIAAEGDALFGPAGVAISRATVASINGYLADHAVAIGVNDWRPRDDGSRVDLVHNCWPLEFVWWDAQARQLMTTTDSGGIEPIIHGDGTWVVYSSHEVLPWQQDAAILPGALVWARHAFGARDWSRGSAAHGNHKVIGELPDGTPLQTKGDDGSVSISTEAAAFLELLEDVAGLDMPVGIRPTGAKVDLLTNSSRAWEVWERLMLNAERAAARTYLGTDGTLGSTGGAPGVDIAQLFGVATTIVQGDIAAIDDGINTGVIEPWSAVNFGDSWSAPTRGYILVDPDEQAARDTLAANEKTYTDTIMARRAAGFEVTQAWADALADKLGVERLQLAAVEQQQEQQPTIERGAPLIELSMPDRFSLSVQGDRQQEPATLDALRSVPGTLIVAPDNGQAMPL